MDRQFKRAKKGAVSLTSLLDLLFVMIFVSLLQQKEISPNPTETKPVAKSPVEIKPKPVEKILMSVNSTFEFYSLGGQQFRGSFLMEGLYNKSTGNLNLAPSKWIVKPPFDIGMVPLSGKISSDKMTFTGRVEFQGCKTFRLNRVEVKPGTPIAGLWKGNYTCSQGTTGLNLTIK